MDALPVQRNPDFVRPGRDANKQNLGCPDGWYSLQYIRQQLDQPDPESGLLALLRAAAEVFTGRAFRAGLDLPRNEGGTGDSGQIAFDDDIREELELTAVDVDCGLNDLV